MKSLETLQPVVDQAIDSAQNLEVDALEKFREIHGYEEPFVRDLTIHELQAGQYGTLAALDDDENIIPFLADISIETPSSVLVDSTDELTLILLAWHRNQALTDSDPDFVALGRELSRHEEQHAEAARTVGIEAIRFGVFFEYVIEKPIENEYFNLHLFTERRTNKPTSKLAWASVTAFPAAPESPIAHARKDMQNLAAMGYPDLDDFSRKIILHNEQGSFIPVPMAFSATL